VTTTQLTRPAASATAPAVSERTTTQAHDGIEDLLARLAEGDERMTAVERRRLVDAVVEATLPLADSLAHRYTGRGIDTEDLVQVARTALVAAVHRYRPGGGRGFEAFAVPTIRGELKRHFRDCGWTVRPPRRLQELRAELSATEESLRHRLGREVSDAELAAALGCPTEDVVDARRCGTGFRPVSLDAPSPGGETAGASLADPEDAFAESDLRATVRAEVARLTQRERLIVQLRFVDECTQSEIGDVLGVSQMQVSRLLAAILGRLGAALGARPAA
jgi:RNA polymerase sigma-B factor